MVNCFGKGGYKEGDRGCPRSTGRSTSCVCGGNWMSWWVYSEMLQIECRRGHSFLSGPEQVWKSGNQAWCSLCKHKVRCHRPYNTYNNVLVGPFQIILSWAAVRLSDGSVDHREKALCCSNGYKNKDIHTFCRMWLNLPERNFYTLFFCFYVQNFCED